MSSGPVGQRPGGLTALAVLNFVLSGFYVLFTLSLFLAAGLAQDESNGLLPREDKEEIKANMGLVLSAAFMYLLISATIIPSGVGYLHQKQFLGRTLGNVYGLLGVVAVVIDSVGSKDFNLWHVILLVYPVLTLILLQTVFKDDFPSP